jgi:riboflavin kinase/FMN adenylyltransferase
MKVIKWTNFLKDGIDLKGKSSSMTAGIFDGVHRGHQALINRVVSHNENNVPVVITFRRNHKTVVNKPENIELLGQAGLPPDSSIQTFEQKLNIFKGLGIQITIVIDFTEAFRKTPGIEFLEILFKRCSIGFFAIGSGFRCGYQLDTDAEAIKKFFSSRSIPVEIIPEVTEGSLPVSSSRIRAAIAAGDLKLAEKMLGRPF